MVHIYQSVPNVEQAPGEYYPKRLSDQVESARRLALRMEDLALRPGLTQLYNYRGLEKMWSTWDEAESWIFVADLTILKASTTHMDIWPATMCSRGSPAGCGRPCGAEMWCAAWGRRVCPALRSGGRTQSSIP